MVLALGPGSRGALKSSDGKRVSSLTVTGLKRELERLGLSSEGLKPELVLRLTAALQAQADQRQEGVEPQQSTLELAAAQRLHEASRLVGASAPPASLATSDGAPPKKRHKAAHNPAPSPAEGAGASAPSTPAVPVGGDGANRSLQWPTVGTAEPTSPSHHAPLHAPDGGANGQNGFTRPAGSQPAHEQLDMASDGKSARETRNIAAAPRVDAHAASQPATVAGAANTKVSTTAPSNAPPDLSTQQADMEHFADGRAPPASDPHMSHPVPPPPGPCGCAAAPAPRPGGTAPVPHSLPAAALLGSRPRLPPSAYGLGAVFVAPGWHQLWDRGAVYYWNELTNESSWHPPPTIVSPYPTAYLGGAPPMLHRYAVQGPDARAPGQADPGDEDGEQRESYWDYMARQSQRQPQ